MNRRHFITGLAGILSAGMAPAIVSAGNIMRIKPVLLPGEDFPMRPVGVLWTEPCAAEFDFLDVTCLDQNVRRNVRIPPLGPPTSPAQFAEMLRRARAPR